MLSKTTDNRSRGARRGRKRVVANLAESKTFALYGEGRRLLAKDDLDQVSIAGISKAADCSVGAFYVRFKSKNAFLRFIIAVTFELADQAAGSTLTFPSSRASEIAGFLVDQFADREFAGVVRTAVKLGFLDPEYRRPFDEYREHLVELIANTAGPKQDAKHRHGREIAAQAALGVLTDAAISSNISLKADDRDIRRIISSLLELELSADKKTRKPKAPNQKISVRDPSSLRKPIPDKKDEPDSSSKLKKI